MIFFSPVLINMALIVCCKELGRPFRLQGYDPCTYDNSVIYFNRPDVQQAMHANTTGIPYRWTGCNEQILGSWHDTAISVLPIYRELLAGGLRLWVYRYMELNFPNTKPLNYNQSKRCGRDTQLTMIIFSSSRIGSWVILGELIVWILQWGRGQCCTNNRHQIRLGCLEAPRCRPLVFLVQQTAGNKSSSCSPWLIVPHILRVLPIQHHKTT
jgi:hypothetical protein